MYDETITLFNRYEDQTGNVFWYPTVLQHVDLITDKVANIVRTGIDSADTASLHVAYTPYNGTIMVQGKKWLSPKAWKAQTNEELPGTITFAASRKNRLILSTITEHTCRITRKGRLPQSLNDRCTAW